MPTLALALRQVKETLESHFPSGRPKWISRKRFETLSSQPLTLRQIAFRICRPGCRPHGAWIITTLTNPRRYPAEELVKLYGKRRTHDIDSRS